MTTPEPPTAKTPTEIAYEAKADRPVSIDEGELAALLASTRQLREADAGLWGKIRLLQLEPTGLVLVQEISDKREILVRRFDDASTAEAFIDARLATYERMWDGCGCRVDYYR